MNAAGSRPGLRLVVQVSASADGLSPTTVVPNPTSTGTTTTTTATTNGLVTATDPARPKTVYASRTVEIPIKARNH